MAEARRCGGSVVASTCQPSSVSVVSTAVSKRARAPALLTVKPSGTSSGCGSGGKTTSPPTPILVRAACSSWWVLNTRRSRSDAPRVTAAAIGSAGQGLARMVCHAADSDPHLPCIRLRLGCGSEGLDAEDPLDVVTRDGLGPDRRPHRADHVEETREEARIAPDHAVHGRPAPRVPDLGHKRRRRREVRDVRGVPERRERAVDRPSTFGLGRGIDGPHLRDRVGRLDVVERDGVTVGVQESVSARVPARSARVRRVEHHQEVRARAIGTEERREGVGRIGQGRRLRSPPRDSSIAREAASPRGVMRPSTSMGPTVSAARMRASAASWRSGAASVNTAGSMRPPGSKPGSSPPSQPAAIAASVRSVPATPAICAPTARRRAASTSSPKPGSHAVIGRSRGGPVPSRPVRQDRRHRRTPAARPRSCRTPAPRRPTAGRCGRPGGLREPGYRPRRRPRRSRGPPARGPRRSRPAPRPSRTGPSAAHGGSAYRPVRCS